MRRYLVAIAMLLAVGPAMGQTTTITATSTEFDGVLTGAPTSGRVNTAASVNTPLQELANGLAWITDFFDRTESYSWSARAFATAQEAWSEGSDRWVALRGGGVPTSWTISGGGNFYLDFGAAGNDWWANTYDGERVCRDITNQYGIQSSLVVTSSVSAVNPGGSTFMRSGPMIGGYAIGSDQSAHAPGYYWVSSMMGWTGAAYQGALVWSYAGTGGSGAATATDATYFTTGSDLELTLTGDHRLTGRFRKTGDVAWTNQTDSITLSGFVPTQLCVVVGRGTSGGAGTQVTITPPEVTVQ